MCASVRQQLFSARLEAGLCGLEARGPHRLERVIADSCISANMTHYLVCRGKYKVTKRRNICMMG